MVTSAATSIPTSFSATSTQYTSGATHGYHGSNNTSTTDRAYCISRNRTNNYTFYYFTITGIPTNATITSVSCIFRARVSSPSYPASVQLFAGDTAKSNSVSVNKTTTTGDIYTLSGGTWTLNEIQTLNLKITHNASANNRWMAFNGADLTVNYECDEGGGTKIYTKTSTGWTELQKVFKKVSGSWAEQSDLTNVFESDKIYVRN